MNSRKHIKNELLERKISAIIRTDNQKVAKQAMQAAVNGGFRVVEFTLTTPGALNLITQFRENDDLIVGAGTVMSPTLAHEAVAAGAQFFGCTGLQRRCDKSSGKTECGQYSGDFHCHRNGNCTSCRC